MIAILYIFGYFIIGLVAAILSYVFDSWSNDWKPWEHKGERGYYYNITCFNDYLENTGAPWLLIFFWPIFLMIAPLFGISIALSCLVDRHVSKKRASRTSSPANTEES